MKGKERKEKTVEDNNTQFSLQTFHEKYSFLSFLCASVTLWLSSYPN